MEWLKLKRIRLFWPEGPGQAQGQVRVDDMVRDAWLAGDITYETAHGAVTDPGVLQAARR